MLLCVVCSLLAAATGRCSCKVLLHGGGVKVQCELWSVGACPTARLCDCSVRFGGCGCCWQSVKLGRCRCCCRVLLSVCGRAAAGCCLGAHAVMCYLGGGWCGACAGAAANCHGRVLLSGMFGHCLENALCHRSLPFTGDLKFLTGKRLDSSDKI